MSEIVEYSLTKEHEERQGLSKLDKVKAPLYEVGRRITGEDASEEAAYIKGAEAVIEATKMVVQNSRNRMQKPPERLKEATTPLEKSDFTLA